jgi:cytochrome P450
VTVVALTVAEFAVLAVAAGALLRLLSRPVVRREAAAHAGLAVALGALALVAAAGLAAVVVAWPAARHVASACALATMIAFAWRARSGYGARQHWPPGSLGVGASLDAIDERRYYRDQAARHGPVFKTSQFGRPVACVVGLERARMLLTTQGDALAPAVLPFNRLLARGALRYMAGPDHRQQAPAFRAAFARTELAAAEPALRASLRGELAALCAASATGGDGVYARAAFERWVLGALARLLLGLAPDDPRVATIRARLPSLAFEQGAGARWRRELGAGLAALGALVRGVARDAAAGAADVAGDSALARLAASSPAALDEPARVENLVLILRVATHDITGLADWIFQFLGDAPQWLEAVRAHGRTAGGPPTALPLDPASCVVLETLRLEQSEYLYRRVVRPLAVDGYTIPAGWILRLCVNESHRDATVFADPDRFDPERFRNRVFGRAEYAPFGGDAHGCMGAHLVHFLGRLFVEELAFAVDWIVVHDGPPERGNRHRMHWRPSARRRVVMRPRAAEPVAAVAQPAPA